MNYAEVLDCDVVNGKQVGISFFAQGCPSPHCEGCFNSIAWDFSGGKEFGEKQIEHFLSLVGREYIKRISILGGEPLCQQNVDDITALVKKCKDIYPDKQIWLWTGYSFDDISNYPILKYLDYVVDGKFLKDQKDLSIAFRGSKNQKIWEKQNDGTWQDRTEEFL